MSFTEHTSNGITYLTSSVIPARHAFTTRLGGVSLGGFASLNLSFGRGDPAENVVENYRRLGAALGIDPFRAAFTKQVHGAHVRVVEEGEGSPPDSPAPCPADGLATSAPGLPIFCFVADCTPVLLHDPQAGTAAAVHCGWRSSVADILGEAVGRLRALGSRPGDIRAAIGPAIGVCCFETGPEVPEAIDAWLGDDSAGVYAPEAGVPGKFMVDLRAANRRRLLQLGLSEENVDVSAECTRCSPERFWSHRAARGGPRGSQCAVIML